jgi:hypothetical protein
MFVSRLDMWSARGVLIVGIRDIANLMPVPAKAPAT